MHSALSLAVFLAVIFAPAVAKSEKETVSLWVNTESQWSQLRKGEIILLESETSPAGASGYSATAAALVDAPLSKVRTVVEDGNKAAGFQASLVSSRILERNEQFTLVEQVVKVGFHKVKYVVRQIPRSPQRMDFQLESGDLKEMDGFWRYLPVDSPEGEQTLLVYRLSLKPLVPIPAFMIQKSIARNLPATLRAVRDETLRREAAE